MVVQQSPEEQNDTNALSRRRLTVHESHDEEARAVQTSGVGTVTCSISTAQLSGFDLLQQDVERDQLYQKILLGSATTGATSLSVGYVIWLVRGGVLMSSVLSSLPAWQMVDPLPVLGDEEDDIETEVATKHDALAKNSSDDDESLEQIVSRSSIKGIDL